MSKKNDDRKNVVIVGGGLVGSLLARTLSSKLDAHKYNLILISDRPYTINLIATARMTVADVDDISDRALIPFDNLFINRNGTYHQGKVVSVDEAKPGAGGEVVLESGERITYAALVLATGSIWSGPLNFPDATSLRSHINAWRKKIEAAKDIYLVGGGAVGIEFAGEIKEFFPKKKVTIVHSGNMLLSSVYPDKYRKAIEKRCRAHNIDLVFNEYVDQFPENGSIGFSTRSGKHFSSADLVIPTFGSRPNTSFIRTLGSNVIASDDCVLVESTLQLQGHPGVFAVGDIIHWRECKQAAKGNAHAAVVAPNVISFLEGRPLAKKYKGSIEMIIVPVGKTGGAGYVDLLWGIVLGDWFARMVKAKDLFVAKSRSDRGL